MTEKTRDRLPLTSELIAFECAARLGNVTRAARELQTSPSAVSRHIAGLERRLSVRLFERSSKGVQLTEPGRRYQEAVVAALNSLKVGGEEAAELSAGPSLVIACSHDASHLIIMPRYAALEKLLGPETRVRLLTFQRHLHELAPVQVADIVLGWQPLDATRKDRVVAIGEEIQPVCSPAYADAHRRTLQGPVSGWGRLKLLDVQRPNMGWATWQDWFAVAGHPDTAPQFEDHDTYTQILEAAAAGRGVALGWKYFIEGHLDRGVLVPLCGEYVRFGACYVATLTAKGRRNPLARKGLSFFEHLA
ncbi:LysR family transcriptional regulator [Candidatus Rariloculus sp.]|uniref:LysR family transcriptional regulator n=1 Tax=Candidatus Rariloculus sp. TaxID=3101265 RepID=UPI003D142AD5